MKRFDREIKLFGERVRKLREVQDLSQLDVEVRCGINRTEISRIENGQKNIEFATIIKLAEALGVETTELFKFEGPA